MRRISPVIATMVVAVGVVAACGGGGGGGDPDASPDADTTLCAGRACLTEIRTPADWDRVSVPYPGERCDFAEYGKYLMPATAEASLPSIVFQDVEAHALHLDFMTQVLPEYFGGLTTQMYQRIVQRRATRQYWAGAVFRLVDEFGETEGYGFDVITDPVDELEEATEADVEAIRTQLATAFHLAPLVYAPTTERAIYVARNFAEVESHFMRACEWITCPNSAADCISVPDEIRVCGHFVEGRSVEAEYAHKIQLTAAETLVELPRTPGQHVVPAVFSGGVYTPSQLAIAPTGATATYTVTQFSGFVSRDYVQTFTAGGHAIELTWSIQLPEEGGGYLLADPITYPGMAATIDGAVLPDDWVHLGGCSARQFEPWRVSGTITGGGGGGGGGDGFAIDVRYQEPGGGSGPMFPVGATVTLGGETRTVDDYFQLVYAGEHHNWNNQYWVLFDAPVTYLGHPVHGLWLDEQGYQFEIESAHTLDANHEALDELTVTGYDFAQVAP